MGTRWMLRIWFCIKFLLVPVLLWIETVHWPIYRGLSRNASHGANNKFFSIKGSEIVFFYIFLFDQIHLLCYSFHLIGSIVSVVVINSVGWSFISEECRKRALLKFGEEGHQHWVNTKNIIYSKEHFLPSSTKQPI